jgi:hypothetical protein
MKLLLSLKKLVMNFPEWIVLKSMRSSYMH